MSKLIKNELTKIFKKKSIYITIMVILAFVILTNCIYKFFMNGNNYYYNDNYIEYAREEIRKLDPNKPSDLSMYIDFKSEIDIYDLSSKYENDAWQRDIIASTVSIKISEKNIYTYGPDKDEVKAREIENQIKEIEEKLDKDDWKYFANEELKIATENLQELEKQEKEIIDKQELEEIKHTIKLAKLEKEIAEIRINKNIKYGYDYMNMALGDYSYSSKAIMQAEKDGKEMTYSQKQEYNFNIKTREINKYILETEQDVNAMDNLKSILIDLFGQYGIFIIVMIVMVAGTIVSEEFSKGTIKLLLVKPYSRKKILLSKFITTLIIIGFTILVVALLQLIVGGFMFGLDSLSMPVVEYNFNTSSLEQINVFVYLGIQIAIQLPLIILLSTLAFALSAISTNSPVAIIIPLLGYMSGSIINMLTIQYNINFMRYFVSMNWEISGYLFGNLPEMEGMTMAFSIVICSIYFIAMIIPAFIAFKKKNIKNI